MKFHVTVLLNFRAQSFSVSYSDFWLSSKSFPSSFRSLFWAFNHISSLGFALRQSSSKS